MIRAFEAHCQGRKVASDMIHPGWLGRGRLRRDRRRQMKTRAPVSPTGLAFNVSRQNWSPASEQAL